MISVQKHSPWMVCSEGKPCWSVCVSVGCPTNPFMCADTACSCHHAHEQHLYQQLKGFLNRLNQKPVLNEGLQKDEKTI